MFKFQQKLKIYFAASCAITLLLFLNISCSKNEDSLPDKVDATMDTTRFSASEGSVALLIKTSGNWSIKEADNQNWLSFSASSGADTTTIRVIFAKNASNNERFAQLVITSGSAQKHLYVSQKPAPDGGYSYNGNYFEIPKDTSIANCIKITRFLPALRSKMRNYTMLYDTNMKLAYWVAYPLHENYLGSTSRTDQWAFDPSIATNLQPSIFSGFSGYDRGHQIPSADRTYNAEDNYTTFYFTNMTAQNSTLNQGIWADLEGQVRTWTKSCDTMYVVTGAIIKTTTSPTINYVYDNIGAKVALPKFYFKALAQKRGSSYYTVAYKMDNTTPSSSASFTSYRISVKQLEQETGFTFFPALTEANKSVIDVNVWK